MIDTLKFPSGTFTHTELALANGKTNQQVWTAYQAAIKAGVIVSAGLRPNSSGKGKPSKIWKVVDGQPVPLVDKIVVVEVKTVTKAELKTELKKLVVQPAEELPKVVPTTAPIVAEVVEVVEFEQPKPVVRNLNCQVVETNEKCPFCQTNLLSIESSAGVRVWCPVNDHKICSCSENPYGESNNIKNAVEILHDKFFKHRKVAKA